MPLPHYPKHYHLGLASHLAMLLATGLLGMTGLWGAEMIKPDFCVAPNGNDTNPGTVEQPFATPERARSAIRQRLAGGAGDLTVLLRGGRYELSEPLVFTADDGAAPGHCVTWAAWPDEKYLAMH